MEWAAAGQLFCGYLVAAWSCIAPQGVFGLVTQLRCVARPAPFYDGTAGLAHAILLRQSRLVVQTADNPAKCTEIKERPCALDPQ